MDLKEFKRDLYEILKKHDVSICSDYNGEKYLLMEGKFTSIDNCTSDIDINSKFFNDIREEVRDGI